MSTVQRIRAAVEGLARYEAHSPLVSVESPAGTVIRRAAVLTILDDEEQVQQEADEDRVDGQVEAEGLERCD